MEVTSSKVGKVFEGSLLRKNSKYLKVPKSAKLAKERVDKMVPGVTKMLGERETQAGLEWTHCTNMLGLGLAPREEGGLHCGSGPLTEH